MGTKSHTAYFFTFKYYVQPDLYYQYRSEPSGVLPELPLEQKNN